MIYCKAQKRGIAADVREYTKINASLILQARSSEPELTSWKEKSLQSGAGEPSEYGFRFGASCRRCQGETKVPA